MEELSIKEVISAVNGVAFLRDSALKIKGVSIDSRTVKEGDLFVAIKGQKVDGHSFVESALQNGAIAALVEKSRLGSLSHSKMLNAKCCLIEVEDTIKALGDLAEYYREKIIGQTQGSAPTVIGITGSNGKTTTKELTAAGLATKFSVLKTERSLNSLIGLPLTLFNLSNKHNYCVLEIGTNQPGEIARLTEIAKPEIGVITNIGPTHLQGFGSVERVLEEKIKLLDNVKVGILNGDDPLLVHSSEFVVHSRGRKIIRFGIYNDCDLRAENIKTVSSIQSPPYRDPAVAGYPVSSFYVRNVPFFLPLLGSYQIYNALAAISVGVQCGVELKEIADVLRNVKPLPHRDEILHFVQNDNGWGVESSERRDTAGICIIDSSYNANPVSMRLAIEELKNIKGKTGSPGGGSTSGSSTSGSRKIQARLIAVLGDMLELGEKEHEEHLEIGKLLDKTGIDVVIAVGNLAKAYVTKGSRVQRFKSSRVDRYYFKEVGSAGDFLKEFIREGDVMLIKSSRAMGLEKIIEMLNVKC